MAKTGTAAKLWRLLGSLGGRDGPAKSDLFPLGRTSIKTLASCNVTRYNWP